MPLKRHILVTGGCGFIGTPLVKKLVALGNNVRVIDLVKPKQPVAKATYVLADVLDPITLAENLADTELVFHLAAKPSIDFCEFQPLESYRNNFLATVAVLEGLLSHVRSTNQVGRIVFASSAAVYGNAGRPNQPLREQEAMTPLSHYGLQKHACEKTIRAFTDREPRLESTILRFFNVYGPGCDTTSPYSAVIPNFLNKIANTRPIQIHGDGSHTRDFVHIDDVVRALICAGECASGDAQATVYNIGTGLACSIKELANTLLTITGKKVQLENVAPRVGDVPHSVANVSNAELRLHWKPSIALETGLTTMLEPAVVPRKKAA
jgi:UDP-glucose 4-epimerase